MGLSQELRQQHAALWERMVTHPFVQELGSDTLPLEKFQRYFLQDYVFVRDFTSLLALGIARAPGFEAARRLASFLADALQGEEGLFRRSFQEWGLRPEQYSPPEATPTAQAYGDFLARTAFEGSFPVILTVLVVSEWTYLDWATRLAQGSKLPKTPVYRAWVDLHSNPGFQDFVGFLRATLDSLFLGPAERQAVERAFAQALRYECQFWEMAYRGEAWRV
ncbi:MAG: TenA family protein [Chloroflexi bacterium]|nr:TenA family protein [Chloroflexota bacterium]